MNIENKPRLEFNKQEHIYKVGDSILPSVSDVLKSLNLRYDPVFSTDEDLWRGQQVHRAIELYHSGKLNEDSLDDRIWPYVAAWRLFLIETGFIPSGWEVPLHDPFWGFAGCPDVWGMVKTPESKKYWLIDIKSGSIPVNEDIKLAAYETLLKANGLISCDVNMELMVVQLNKNGLYHMVKYGTDCRVYWIQARSLHKRSIKKSRRSI